MFKKIMIIICLVFICGSELYAGNINETINVNPLASERYKVRTVGGKFRLQLNWELQLAVKHIPSNLEF